MLLAPRLVNSALTSSYLYFGSDASIYTPNLSLVTCFMNSVSISGFAFAGSLLNIAISAPTSVNDAIRTVSSKAIGIDGGILKNGLPPNTFLLFIPNHHHIHQKST